MSDTAVEQVEAVVTPDKPAKRGAAQKEKMQAAAKKSPATVKKAPKAKINHPQVGEMVIEAIETLNERKGSSLLAIKKYLAVNFKVDAVKMTRFIKKYIISAIASGILIQPKGTGFTSSFKMNDAKPKRAYKSRKPVAAVEKTASAKKTVAAKKAKAAAAKTATKAKPALKQKTTKPSKAAAPKTKAPILKKAVSAKKAITAAPKKVAPKRK